MLVLSRKRGEQIVIPGSSITITVVGVKGDNVRLGIAAPAQVRILREELVSSRLSNQKELPMKTSRNWKTIAGWVLHGLIAGMMILAGSAKVFGLFPPAEVAKLGLSLPIQVIGVGELASAILLLIPRTSSLGLLLTTGFWGGAICLHMSKADESFVMQSVFLLLTWVGGYLRVPGALGSFTIGSEPKQVHNDAVEALTV